MLGDVIDRVRRRTAADNFTQTSEGRTKHGILPHCGTGGDVALAGKLRLCGPGLLPPHFFESRLLLFNRAPTL